MVGITRKDRIKNTYMRPLLIKKNCMHARIGDCDKRNFKGVGLDGLDTYGKQHTYKVLQRFRMKHSEVTS